MAEASLVLFEVRDHVATITLNRPEKLNALSAELVEELVGAFARARQDDAVRTVVMTGSGRAFSAGADLGGRRGDDKGRSIEEWWATLQGNIDRQMLIRDFP